MNFDLRIWRNTGAKMLVIQVYIKLSPQYLKRLEPSVHCEKKYLTCKANKQKVTKMMKNYQQCSWFLKCFKDLRFGTVQLYLCYSRVCSGLEIQNTQVSQWSRCYEFGGNFDSKVLTLLYFMDCRTYGKIVTFRVGKQLIKKKSDALFFVCLADYSFWKWLTGYDGTSVSQL